MTSLSPADSSEELIHTIVAIIAEVTNTDPSEMWPDAQLLEDLNITEDAFRVIVRRLNQEFEINLNNTDMMSEFDAITIKDLTDYVDEEINLG